MPQVEEVPYSQLTLEELETQLLALRARRVEVKAPTPRVSRARTPKGAGSEIDVSGIFAHLVEGLPNA